MFDWTSFIFGCLFGLVIGILAKLIYDLMKEAEKETKNWAVAVKIILNIKAVKFKIMEFRMIPVSPKEKKPIITYILVILLIVSIAYIVYDYQKTKSELSKLSDYLSYSYDLYINKSIEKLEQDELCEILYKQYQYVLNDKFLYSRFVVELESTLEQC